MFAGSPVSHASRLMLVFLAISSPLAAQTTPAIFGAPEAGVSRTLAYSRSARLSDLHYKLTFALHPHAETTEAQETLTFTDSGTGDLPLDYRDGTLNSASLNGTTIPAQLTSGHLILPAAALHKGANTLTIAFKSNIAAAGKAITRYVDRDDKNEYLYTLFVPMDASMAFPCFDQPDLKARFTLDVSAPTDWTVIGNTAPTSKTPNGETAQSVFPETRPISTYLFAFAAGPFEAIQGKPGEPTIYVRKSQLTRAQAEAPQVQQITARGVAYLSDYFAQPFPFPKYDLVLIPGFPFGGMEHAGATFLNEDGVLFRTAPTASDYFRRDILVLHETTHQWFGDLVTMRWFDDLWLKEGFAQYMAYKAMAKLEPQTNPWKHFSEDIKPLAYAIDETEGTTPIFQDIPNLKDAKSAYGAIVYQKAPSILKQLNFHLGEENFRGGLRLYLAEHAYSNAKWDDLIEDFDKASGDSRPQDPQTRHPYVSPFRALANAWIPRRGMPEVSAYLACTSGTIERLVVGQTSVLPDGYQWPMSLELFLGYPTDSGQPSMSIPIHLPLTEPIKQVVGKPCPAVIFANYNDEGYGRFLLDDATIANLTRNLISQRLGAPPPYLSADAPGQPVTFARTAQDDRDAQTEAGRLLVANRQALLRSQLWAALWNSVETGRFAPTRFVLLALNDLQSEDDESIARILGGHAVQALRSYIHTGTGTTGAILAEDLERVTSDRMMHAPTVGLRIVNFHIFAASARSDQAVSTLHHLLSGTASIPGVELRSVDRWNLITRLTELGDDKDHTLLNAEREQDHSSDASKYAFATEAASPSADTKKRYFALYQLKPGTPDAPQEDWITQSLHPFNSIDQAELTAPYLTQALGALPDIKANRKIFFLGVWLSSFLEGQNTPESAAEALDIAKQQASQGDPDLRRKILEAAFPLQRTVKILEKFPE